MFANTFRTAAPRAFTRSFSSSPASQLARMTVVGRLGVAPEEVTISGDRTLVRYVIGSSFGKGEDKKTSWFRVASFVQGAQKDFLMSVPKGYVPSKLSHRKLAANDVRIVCNWKRV